MDFFLPDKKEEGKLRDRHLITYCVDIYLGLTRVIDIQETTTLYASNINLLLVSNQDSTLNGVLASG